MTTAVPRVDTIVRGGRVVTASDVLERTRLTPLVEALFTGWLAWSR